MKRRISILTTLALATMVIAAARSEQPSEPLPALQREQDEHFFVRTDRDLTERLSQSDALATDGRWADALSLYHRLLHTAGAAVLPSNTTPGLFLSLKTVLHQRLADALGRCPPEVAAAFRRSLDADAEVLYESALRQGHPDAFGPVLQHYLFSSYGGRALEFCGDWYFDRGQFEAAETCWALLERLALPSDAPPGLLFLRRAAALALMGARSEAQARLQNIPDRYAHESVTVAGQIATVQRHAELLRRQLEMLPPPKADRGAEGHPIPVRALWAERTPFRSRPGFEVTERDFTDRGFPVPLPYQVAVADAVAVLQTRGSVRAIDVSTGKRLWRTPLPQSSVEGVAPHEWQFEPRISGKRVYVSHGPALYALARTTGQLLWQASLIPPQAGDQEALAAPASAPLIVPSAPEVSGNRVLVAFTQMRKEAEAHLAAVDSTSGEVVWRLFFCSRASATFNGMGLAPSTPVAYGTTAYVVTHLGAIAAADILTGDLMWLYSYPSAWPERREQELLNNHQWANCTPLVWSGVLVAAPRDAQFLYGLDSATGHLLWRVPRNSHRYLAGRWSDTAILCGEYVEGIEITTGRTLWRTDALPESVHGRPALVGSTLLAPTAQSIMFIDVENGQAKGRSHLLPSEVPGNLAADASHIFSSSLTTTLCLEATDSAVVTTSSQEAAVSRSVESAFRRGEWMKVIDLHNAAFPAGHTVAPAQSPARALAFEAARRAAHDAAQRSEATERIALLRQAAALATRPADRAAALVDLARTLETQAEWSSAVVAWQEILSNVPETPIALAYHVTVPSDSLARRAIFQICEEYGTAPYAAFETEARTLFESARQAENPEILLAVLGRYPHSSVAWPALSAYIQAKLQDGKSAELRRTLMPLAEVFAASRQYSTRLAAAADLVAKGGDLAFARSLWLHLRRFGQATVQLVGQQAVPAAALAATRLTNPAYAPLGGLEGADLSPPMAELWRSGPRLEDTQPNLLRPLGKEPSAMAGRFLVACADSPRRFAVPYHRLECREIETGTLVWRVEPGPFNALSAYYENLLILAGASQVAAVRVADGRVAWSASIDPAIPPSAEQHRLFLSDSPIREALRIVDMAVAGSRLYCATLGGQIFAFNATNGQRLWLREAEPNLEVKSGSLVATERFVSLCSEVPAKVFVFDTADTETASSVFPFPGVDARLTREPAVDGSRSALFALIGDRQVFAIRFDPLGEMWSKMLDFSVDRILLDEAGSHLVVLPLTGARWGRTRGARILCLDARTGRELWTTSAPSQPLASAFLDFDTLYLGSATETELRITALDLHAGHLKWLAQLPRGYDLIGLHAAGAYIAAGYVADPDQFCISLIDRTSGRVVDTQRVHGALWSSMQVYQGTLCAATNRGLFAFGFPFRGEAAVQLQQALLQPAQSAAQLSYLASLCTRTGQDERAAALLELAARQSNLDDDVLLRIHEQLLGIREALAANRPPLLVAEKTSRPSAMTGRVADAWPLHRSEILRGLRHVAPVAGAPAPLRPWEGPDDLSGRLSVTWDDKALYLLVDVSDSVHRNVSERGHQRVGDALMVAIDPENDGGYGFGLGGNDFIFTQALMERPPRDEEGDAGMEGQYAVQRRDDDSGTVYQSAIPWSYLRGMRPVPGTIFGLNIAVMDDDGAGVQKTLQRTPGLELHSSPFEFGRGYAPAHFGKVLLVDEDSDDE